MGEERALKAGHPGALQAWVLALRPKTLPAAVAPVIAGSALAAGIDALRIGPALACALGAVLLQIGSNLANDVYDYERGADTEERLGPLRVTQAGLLTPRAVRLGMAIVFGLSMLVGAYLVALGGWPIVVIGISAIVASIAYTGGPFPLAYNGLGDVFVMIFFGFAAVGGTIYVQAGYVPGAGWLVALGVGCAATAILAVNNVRDVETDARAGKRTLPVLLGRRAGVIEYGALLFVAFLLVPLALFAWVERSPVLLLPLLLLAEAARMTLLLARERGSALNRLLGATARLLALYALLLAPGLALSEFA
jgi:1,4-dihydroxy-2-naphthoate octaprenyltransferase